MKQYFTTSVASLALLLVSGLTARAESLPPPPFTWTFDFTATSPSGTSTVYADGSTSAGLLLSNEPNVSVTKSGTDVVLTNLKTFTPPGADNYNITRGAYSINLLLKYNDGNGIQAGNLTVTGELSGSFSKEDSGVKNKFTSPTTSSVTIGNYIFTLSELVYAPPGPTTQGNVAGISGHIEVTTKPTTSGGNAPEPGTLVLSGLGLSFLGGAAYRRRRKARAR